MKLAGEGPLEAEIVCLGEAPGQEEDESGRPFVGRAGDILNQALYEADLPRESVFVTNAARCRPYIQVETWTKNRTPTVQELGFCRGWLDDELSQLPNKKVIVALGASATWSLMHPNQPAGGVLENQGKTFWSERYQCWVVTSLHPAFIARKPAEAMWLAHDLVQAQRIVRDGKPPEQVVAEVRVIETLDEALDVRDQILKRAQFLWWDWETDGVHPLYARGLCCSFAVDYRDNFAWVFPRYNSNFTARWTPRQLRVFDDVLRDIFLSEIPKGGHHVGFDDNIALSTLGVRARCIEVDTMIAHHLIMNHLGGRAHSLKRLATLYSPYGRYDDGLDRWLIEHGHVKEAKPDMAFAYKAPNSILHVYNGTDAVVPRYVWPYLKQKIEEADLWDVFVSERMPFALAYAGMDRHGVKIDVPRLDRLGVDLQEAMDAISGELTSLAGRDFNFNSYPQVQKLLFQERGLPILKRTETGQPSTREEDIKPFEDEEPAVSLILHGRAYSKLKGTFVDGKRGAVGGLKAAVDEDDYARTDTFLTVTETFRLATRKPMTIHTIPRPLNMWRCMVHGRYLFDQCCPLATQTQLNIRSLIIPERTRGVWNRFIDADFMFQEYLLGAIIFKQTDWEEAMAEHHRDPHEYVMELLSGRSRAEFGQKIDGKWLWHSDAAETGYKNLRADWKRVNFMIFYRGGAKHLAQSLSTKTRKVSEEEAARMIEQYYDGLPNIKWGQYNLIKALRETGVVYSPFRTYRRLPGIWSTHYADRNEAERQGCNAPIQMSGYHVMARAVLRLKKLWAGDPPLVAPYPAEILFTVHDELVAQTPHDMVEETQAQMVEEMSRPHPELVGGCGIARGIPAEAKVIDAWGGLTKEEQVALEREMGLYTSVGG